MRVNLGNKAAALKIVSLVKVDHDSRAIEDLSDSGKVLQAGFDWFISNIEDAITNASNSYTNIQVSTEHWRASSIEVLLDQTMFLTKMEEKFPQEGFEREVTHLSIGGTKPTRYLGGWYFSFNYRELFIKGAREAYDSLVDTIRFLENFKITFGSEIGKKD